jgi:hypothetical protein
MFSIRNLKSAASCSIWSATLLALGAGCNMTKCPCSVFNAIKPSTLYPTPNVIKTPSPIAEATPADEATELRDFRRSYALIHSGAVQAWPTRWYYQPNADYVTVEDYVAEPVMVIVQTVTLPVVTLVDYPFRKVYYDGDVFPLSYTAMPPLPPEPLNSRLNPDPDPLSALQEPVLPPIRPLPVERPPIIPPPPESKPAETKPVETKPPVMKAKAKPEPPYTAPTTRPAR